MKVKQTVTLPYDDLEWLQKEYSEFTISSILTLLLRNFRSIHQDVGLTPNKAAKDAAKELKEMINEGIFSEIKKQT